MLDKGEGYCCSRHTPASGSEDINGPYDFRQLLRPTEHPPTESLRKRVSERCQNRTPNVKVV